ncbi:MAG TPA: PQQ-binding-like beta-propeller repeat protein [Bryobacteraceae bacterium]|nr:PQQ-binding-like beta-propeller repeat protein [Bryobacteraceae bacterium]
MRKKRIFTMAALACGLAYGADWLTDGYDAKRTAWQRDEHILNKDNVKNLQILWKLNLGNQPREMHSLFPPLIVSNVPTSNGPKQIAIDAGISDNIYAIDVEAGKVLWQKHFEYPPITEGRGLRAGDPLCPGGQTATPIVGPPTASGARVVYAMAGNGEVHTLNVANGEEMAAPFKFGFGNGKSYALNLWDGYLFTTTSQGCNGNPNQMWAVKIDDPQHKVLTASPKSGGLWGRTGAAIDSNGVAWAPTGDGRYEKDTQTYGNGLIGAKVVDGQLKIEDYFIPSNWSWLQKRDLDFQVTPTIFNYKGRELMATASKECRVYLLDTKNAGGDDHQTPLDRTPLICNEEVNFASAGIWGSMATWEDSKGTRWVLTPFWGPVHPKFKVPVSYGPVKDGAVVAFKVEEKDGKTQLVPAWMSRDMNRAEPPVIANGVVYAYGNGENTEQAYADRGLDDSSPLRIRNSTHAVLYALDAETGKELYSSGDQIKAFNHFSGLTVANGRVYIGTFDSTLYCFGLPGK